MHSRRSVLGIPGDKGAPLSGSDEQLQLDLYAATDTPLLRTDRLPPASFGPPPRSEPSRPCPPQFQPAPTTDYSADLNLAELLMSDTDDSLAGASLGQLTLSSIVPARSNQPGAKFATAPSRVHNRASTSRFDMRFASRPTHLAADSSLSPHSWPSSSNNSSPATTSTRLSTDPMSTTDRQLVSQPDQDKQLPANHNSKRESPSPTSTSTTGPAPTESTTPSSTSTTTTKQRSSRTARRSPAPRRQECTTCGKRFQRPCQLVTHIRSHTGEQPHACNVCGRRFSVLSNCQRHVKLCQKRSAKVLNPGEEESPTESAAAVTPFIQFSNDQSAATESATRRSHEIPIRPKLVSRESGSTNSSVGRPVQRQKTRSGSNSSVGSLAPKSEPSMAPSLERRGSGSAVPVVPSSPAYPQGPYSASYAYPPSNTYENYGQGRYESPGSTYNAYGPSYGASGTGYDGVTPVFERPNATAEFEQVSADAYDSLNPSFSTPNTGYERSLPAYATSSPAFDNLEPGFNQPHQYAAPAAGPPPIQSLPSPSHVQPTPHLSASPTSASHEAGSYFTHASGVYAAARSASVTPSIPSRRSTIAHTLVQRDQPEFRDAGITDPSNMGTTSDAGAGQPASGPYYSSGSGLVAAQYEAQQPKQEEVTPDLDHQAWSKEQQSYQTGYSEPQWASVAGTEAPSYNAYHTGSSSSTDLTGPHDNHVASAPTGYAVYPQQPQQPQPRQPLYLSQAQGGYSNSPVQQQPQQQAQQHDAYSSSGYADRSTVYGMNSGVVSVPGHSHQDSPNYAWPGSEPAWDTQAGYHS